MGSTIGIQIKLVELLSELQIRCGRVLEAYQGASNAFANGSLDDLVEIDPNSKAAACLAGHLVDLAEGAV